MLEQRKMKVWSRAGWLVTLVFCIVSSNTAVRAEDNDDSSAARTSNREARQFDFGDSEQKYDLELSFPIDADEATNNDGRIERIDQLIQSILSNEELAVNDTVPGTFLDPSSFFYDTVFECEEGQVVVDQQCVACPPGTYFDESQTPQVCTKCNIGFYNPDFAKRACTKCPTIQDVESITETIGATSADDCKRKCSAGQYYDVTTGLCRNCGYGKYQPEEGKFSCEICGVGLTTRIKKAISASECRPDCQDGYQLSINGECERCPIGSYRTQGIERGCKECPVGRTTGGSDSKSLADCNLPICIAGQYLNGVDNECRACPVGTYQPDDQQTTCIDCPPNTSTPDYDPSSQVGATSQSQCTNRCQVKEGERQLCDKHAVCLFKPPNDFNCQCKWGYNGTGLGENSCFSVCDGFCRNGGECLVDPKGEPYCQCAGSFTGIQCAEKSEFAYIAGGIAGAVLFVIVLVLLVWMICVRSARNRARSSEKFAPSVGDMTGSQVNFYYGAPAPYAESIAPSHHGSTYAHYYEDEEDGWGMPNFYDTYGKNSKIARSNGSLYNAGMYAPQYAPQGELYDRLGKHAYQPRPEDKSGNDTTSESDDDRSRRQ